MGDPLSSSDSEVLDEYPADVARRRPFNWLALDDDLEG